MSNKRKRRTEIANIEPELDLLKPLDVLSLGSEDDPCFGKLHDLKAPECKICGDADFCAIAKAQNLHLERSQIEETQRFKDTEEVDLIKENKIRPQAEELIDKYKDLGLKRMKIILKVSRELSIPKDMVKEFYN